MDHYGSKGLTPINGCREWVCGDIIKQFTASNKLQWHGHVMTIDYEMEVKSCDFTECLCDTRVPTMNRRHVIPHQFYDRFGLYNATTRNKLRVEGKP